MSRRLCSIALAFCCTVLLAAAAVSWAGDDYKKAEQTKAQAEKKAEMGGDMSPAKPGPMHAMLQKAVGKWKYKNTMKMDPSMPPVVSEGTEEVVSLCGGLFIESSNKAGGPMPFEGHGIEGYDAFKKKFVGSWIDNWGTSLYSYEGTCNAEGTVFTYTMTGPNPGTGETMVMSMVTEYKGNNARTFKMWQGAKPEGEPSMVIEYTRSDVADRR
jgi:hypothetical protein